MPSPKLRAKRLTGALTPSQAFFLRFGSVIGDPDGSYAFATGPDHRQDLKAVRAAWNLHRHTIEARIPAGYVAWAAREFDRAVGPISAYDHLGRPNRTLADYR